MLPQPFSSQNIFRQGTGEATVLKSETPDVTLALATEQQKRQREVEATPEKMIAAWDTDYFPLVDQMRTEKEQIASRVANGELTPEKAAIEYRRRADELVSMGKLTQKQETDWNAVGEIYAKDDKGLYNTTQGYTNMNIYKSPEKYAEAIPQIAEQLKSVGGDRVMWRAKYGTPYLQPALAYDHNKMINDEFGKIEEITGSKIDPLTGLPGLTGLTVTEETNPNVAATVGVGRRIRDQALTGNNFKAQEFYKTANQYIGNNFQVDESGNLNMTPGGKELLRTMTEHFGYDPETGTIMTGPDQRQEITPDLMQSYLYDAYVIQEGTKLQEKKTKINATLRQQTNVNVSNGGGVKKPDEQTYWGDVSNLMTAAIVPGQNLSMTGITQQLGGKIVYRPNTDDPTAIELPVPSQLAGQVIEIPRSRATPVGGGVLPENIQGRVDKIVVQFGTIDANGGFNNVSEAEYNNMTPEQQKKVTQYATVTFGEVIEKKDDKKKSTEPPVKGETTTTEPSKVPKRVQVRYILTQGSAQADELNELAPGLFVKGRRDAEESFGKPGSFEDQPKFEGQPENYGGLF